MTQEWQTDYLCLICFRLELAQVNRVKHLFSKRRGVARFDDRTILRGVIHLIHSGPTLPFGPKVDCRVASVTLLAMTVEGTGEDQWRR